MYEHVIYKYPFTGSKLDIPWRGGIDGSHVLHIAAQSLSDDLPTVWVEQPTDIGTVPLRRFRIRMAGELFSTYDEDLSVFWSHVGSAACAEGELVWHVYATRL